MDKSRAEILKKVLDLLEEEQSYGGEVEEPRGRDPMGMYRIQVPQGFYDPGWARLRKLGWPNG